MFADAFRPSKSGLVRMSFRDLVNGVFDRMPSLHSGDPPLSVIEHLAMLIRSRTAGSVQPCCCIGLKEAVVRLHRGGLGFGI